MNISLTPELETLIGQKVKTGHYNSPSEVVREALRLLDEQDRVSEMRREELRNEIMKGVEQIRNGDFIEIKSSEESREFGENIIRRGRERLEAEKRGK